MILGLLSSRFLSSVQPTGISHLCHTRWVQKWSVRMSVQNLVLLSQTDHELCDSYFVMDNDERTAWLSISESIKRDQVEDNDDSGLLSLRTNVEMARIAYDQCAIHESMDNGGVGGVYGTKRTHICRRIRHLKSTHAVGTCALINEWLRDKSLMPLIQVGP